MLSWPDFEEKQIVFIDSKDIKNLLIKNGNLAVKEDGEILSQVPLAKIFTVMIAGNATFTSTLIQKLIKHGASILLMNRNFLPYCFIGGETEGNFLLREKQYVSENDLKQAKWLVGNKVQNQQALLKNVRNKTKEQKLAIGRMDDYLDKIVLVDSPKTLLGIEGNCSKEFFSCYFNKFGWHGRKPRSKFDEKNTLFDIGYTMLFNFVEANLRLYGFDIYRGFYHTDFYQRKSLVCDLMEPFRCIIDHSLYRIFTLKIFDANDFKVKNGGYSLKRGCGKKYISKFLEAIMGNKEEIFKYIQSYYRQMIKGKDDYPIFLIKK